MPCTDNTSDEGFNVNDYNLVLPTRKYKITRENRYHEESWMYFMMNINYRGRCYQMNDDIMLIVQRE